MQLGYGFRLFPLISVIIVAVLLERLDNKHGLSNTTREQYAKSVLYFSIFVLGFLIMRASGFYEAMELYELGSGLDPHVGSVGWITSKLTVFWIFIPLIQTSDFKAPLRLDPKVLIW